MSDAAAAQNTDARLLEAARRGEGAALEELLATCRLDIKRYAQRTCHVSHVDDAVQESLLIVLGSVGRLRSLFALRRWLFQIVRRECLRMAAKFGVPYAPLEAVCEGRYLSQHSNEELRLDIACALQSLPDHYREVILLRDMEGLTVGEIARVLNIPAATVKTRIARARGLVREYLLSE